MGADHVERCSIKALARILRIILYSRLVRSSISFSPDPTSNHMRLHPAFGSHLVVGIFSTGSPVSPFTPKLACSGLLLPASVVDHFYAALFSTLKQTHCTRVTCDSESAAFDQTQSAMKFHGCCKVIIRISETFDQTSHPDITVPVDWV